MAFKKRNSVVHGTRIHGEMLALNYDACACNLEDGRSESSAFQHTHTDSAFMSNKFMGEREKAIKAGEKSFNVGNKTYEVTGDTKPFQKGGCGNPVLGADNVVAQSASAPYKYKNGYAFKAVCMDPGAANYGQEVPERKMGGSNYTISYDG